MASVWKVLCRVWLVVEGTMHGSVVVGTIGCNIHGTGKQTAGTASQQHHHTLAGKTMLASLVPMP